MLVGYQAFELEKGFILLHCNTASSKPGVGGIA